MTTVTVGVLGGAGLAAAAAVAGAVGLGLLALAGAGRRSNRRRNGHRRYGREAGEAGAQDEEWPALENLLQDVRRQDTTGCGRRLLCELAQEDEEALSLEELEILSLVGPDVTPGEGLLPPGGASGEFARARAFGRDGGDCGAAFPLCPLNGTQLMDSVMAYLP
ncbi:uncharacterized protein LOC122256622 [Penaeus japonicus]|uniref:uncharacterized protein LOC122256621 n=1 Tax=Penaeus japonicus TaxID=27405 RepID=UPI001C7159C1|nr:uncharacterized protein LOC122256621 [Penaeus japonicus]XP_042877368.1 uncharacterized protein LOC122256621 [Penaeus japonicus]XP_042877370.1 uncharacterized protein LOC122256622 [Penaeus japonicus]